MITRRFTCWVFSGVLSVDGRNSFVHHDCPTTFKLFRSIYTHFYGATKTASYHRNRTTALCSFFVHTASAWDMSYSTSSISDYKRWFCARIPCCHLVDHLSSERVLGYLTLIEGEALFSSWSDNWQCVRQPARNIRLKKSTFLPYLFHEIISRQNIV